MKLMLQKKIVSVFLFAIWASLQCGLLTQFASAEPQAPRIDLSTKYVNFNAVIGEPPPPSQTVILSNGGDGTLAWFGLEYPSLDWFSFNPTSGSVSGVQTNPITISVYTANLQANTYNGRILIYGTGAVNSPETIYVSLTVAQPAMPHIELSDDTLNFYGVQGGSNPPPQYISITNGGGGTLNWYRGPIPVSWLIMDPSNGTAPSSIRFAVDISTRPVGTHTTQVLIYANGADNSPQTVFVRLVVTATPSPLIVANPPALNFSAIQGGSNPPPQYVSITNGGGGTLNWYAIKHVSWLDISPLSGIAPSSVQFAVLISGRPPGIWTDTVLITASGASNSPLEFVVTLTITAQPSLIVVTPETLKFIASQNGANPSPQYVTITNGGGGTLNWSASKHVAWLTVFPANGTAPSIVSFSVSPQYVPPGIHYDNVLISAAGASNSPETVVVKFEVIQGPLIGVTPKTLFFTARVGDPDPEAQIFYVVNMGGGALDWTSTQKSAWLSLTPSNGTAPTAVEAAVHTAGLLPDLYSDTVQIRSDSAANSPETVIVFLDMVPTDVQDRNQIDGAIPEFYALDQNYPNPFNPTTRIRFSLPRPAFVQLEIFNILGQKINTLVNEELSAGVKEVTWNGTGATGLKVASGIYFYRLKTSDYSEVKRMLLLK